MVATALISLYLLSELGVEGNADHGVFGVAELGAMGVIAVTSTAVISLIKLTRTHVVVVKERESEREGGG